MGKTDPTAAPGDRLRRLFDELAELPPEERRRRLDALDPEEPGLESELAALLAAHDRAGGFLEGPTLPLGTGSPAAGSPAAGSPASLAPIGERLGDYRVVRLLGRGGMGSVFLARRADGAYDQLVAIKLLDHVGQDSRAIRRFERERQMLAKLTHPNIARLLDGGTTGEGIPFLVMEYIEGQHIDHYCDERRLDVPGRLRLFLQVCAGVQHAHRHLVVHRDLKPGNILVTEEGEVKLLDFGIAKLLGELDDASPAAGRSAASTAETEAPGTGDLTTLTVAGESAFTPGYASPEQLLGEQVSAASDVFALGLILHELLCGVHPYAAHRRSLRELSAAVIEEPAATPSLAFVTAAGPRQERAAEIAALRGVAIPTLRRQLRGDLDAILLKALAKSDTERYAAAGELALDLERHLDGRPVQARAGERAYVARTLARRHRLPIAAALVLLLALVGGLAATAWQAARAERALAVAERRFRQVQELARALLFDVHDAVARLPGATPARHLLVERALVYLDSLRADAAGDPSLQLELATAYERIGDIQGNPNQANLGDTAAALDSYHKALDLRLAQPAAAQGSAELRAAVARTRHRIGEVLWWTGETEEAARQLALAIDGWRELAAADPGTAEWRLRWAESLRIAARVESWNGAHEEALERYRAAEELLTALALGGTLLGGDPGSPEVDRALALVHQGRGETLGWMGEIDAGLEELGRARGELAELSARHPLDGPLRRQLYLASLRHSSLLQERSVEQSIASFGETLALAEELAAADPANALARRDLSLAHASLGDALSNAGDRPAALQHFREAERLQRRLAQDDPHNLGHQADLANTAMRIGYLQAEQDELTAALASHDRSLALRLTLHAADPEDASVRRDLAVSHSARGDVLAALAERRPEGAARTETSRRACAAYRESLALWRQLEAAELLRGYDRPQLDYAAGRVGTCDDTP